MENNKFNKQRKIILEMIDSGNIPTNMELGLYDLTPYFDTKVEDANLTESIMLNKNKERRIEHVNKELYFSPEQFKALHYLFNNDRVILSAPTSFGKTLLVKEYIYKAHPQKVIYIVPTNALAYELEKSFKENDRFSDYVIYDKCLCEELPLIKKQLFIGTQEKYLELSSNSVNNADLFVIDEAYKLKDTTKRQRSYKLSETFIDSVARKSEKIFLLTPNATILGFEKYEFSIFTSDFNAVEKNYHTVNNNIFFDVLLDKGKKEKTILFCSSPTQLDDVYNKIEHKISDEYRVTSFAKSLEDEIHPDWSVAKLLRAGILSHHGQMPKYIQNKMIRLFNESNDYNILFGTNSISEGINTVTKNLFIHPDYSLANPDVLLLKNTIGRAGRLGVYPIGHIYSVNDIEYLTKQDVTVELALSRDEELEEIESNRDNEKIAELCFEYEIDLELCHYLLDKYKISLNKLGIILSTLQIDRCYVDITNLVYMAYKAFPNDYRITNFNFEKTLIRGYLQDYYYVGNNRCQLNNFNDRIIYFKFKNNNMTNNSEIINLYMRFIYSTLEYYIMPMVNIGMDISTKNPSWHFGNNVYDSLKLCKDYYLRKTYGSLNYDSLSEPHKRIIGALRDYGIYREIMNINESILKEIEEKLNIRYSTFDVLNAIVYLSNTEGPNRDFYIRIRNKYIS